MTKLSPILDVNKLSKTFGELVALHNIDFQLENGEILGLAGPNGSGKTTLFNTITGIVRGTGIIKINNENINGQRPHQICRKGIARTFQTPTVFKSLSIKDNIQVGLYFGNHGSRKMGKKFLNEIIEHVGLSERTGIQTGLLSLFDRKLTMLAAALATSPKVLLIDEPLAALSPSEIDQILSLIRRINEMYKIAIIVIEHKMKELIKICDKLMILKYGHKICMGPPYEVMKDKRVIESYLGKKYANRK